MRHFLLANRTPADGNHLPNCVRLTALGLGYFSNDFWYSPINFRYWPITQPLQAAAQLFLVETHVTGQRAIGRDFIRRQTDLGDEMLDLRLDGCPKQPIGYHQQHRDDCRGGEFGNG
jgi:hypothetical protein